MRRSGFTTEDAIALARRGSLSDAEAHRLKVALGASRENQLLYDAGRGFDHEDCTLPGDEILVLRVADRISATIGPRKRKDAKSMALLAVAGVLIASAAAAAGWVIESRREGRENDVARLDAQRRIHSSRPRHSGGASSKKVLSPTESTGAEAELDQESTGASARAAGVTAQVQALVRPVRSREAGESKAQDASTLFAEGNRARRSGTIALAVETYGKLTQRFPNAPEAQQAKLIVAELELQRGQARRALEYFRECRGGSMAPEAIWGMARAYRAVSDTRREQDMLEALVTEYPDSAYAEAARHRLDELQ